MSNQNLANCIRFLAIDAIQAANSGHPGMPMGMADVASVLFCEFLQFNPKDPKWPNRDHFVLSAGHGSMLLYSVLYLTGYQDISLADLKNFRKLQSKCAGHPEFGELEGIETTTGPLGQGVANAVGMAISQKLLAARFGNELFNHKIYALIGDGCLMEGISQESLSLAGHLKLENLVLLWDNNSITIDGDISIATSENMHQRFLALGFEIIAIDGHNFDQIREALKKAQNSSKPVLIDCKTVIGFGSPNKAGTHKVHGSALGNEEVLATRKNLNWNYSAFEIPAELLETWRNSSKRSEKSYQNWQQNFAKLSPELKTSLASQLQKTFPQDFAKKFSNFKAELISKQKENPFSQATRKSSQIVLEFLTNEIAALIGGSADLTDSVLTKISATKSISSNDFSGRYLHYGIREHAMAAIMNGLSLHGNFIPFGGTFLVFADYLKPALRLSALMKRQVIYVLTHDSIGLGEDGPTHQPVEQLAMLRSIPNLLTFRPCDEEETANAYEIALSSHNSPSAIVLSRQNLPFISKPNFNIVIKSVTKNFNETIENSCSLGAYIVFDSELSSFQTNQNFINQDVTKPDVIIFASGSEVSIAMQAKDLLIASNLKVRIVSVLSFELFFRQSDEYKNWLCGRDISAKGQNSKPILAAIEAGLRFGWDAIIGNDAIFVGMNSFGASGKAEDLYQYFQITAQNLTSQILEKIKVSRN